VLEDETCGQEGSPERLHVESEPSIPGLQLSNAYLIEVTSQPRATADLQMREPKKPLPPATTSFFLAAPEAAEDMLGSASTLQASERMRPTRS
jgi:hypothetical protein